jgi:hypothetical protein
MRPLLVTANVVLSSPIVSTLMIEPLRSSETLFLQEPKGVPSQDTAFFIVTAVKTSNLTRSNFINVVAIVPTLSMREKAV